MGSALHLVVAWFFEEPERVGQVARMDGVSWLGRPHPQFDHEPPLQFFEQRPGGMLAMANLMSTRLSRRQLKLTPLEGGRLHVENVGKRALWVNGSEAREANVSEGATLMLENTAVFLVEARPPRLPPPVYYTDQSFRFGGADPQGMVGEHPSMWALRDRLAAVATMDGHVLLLGETGSGKELAAQALHQLSPRRAGPLVARNAATIPETLLDAELFGNAKHYPHLNAAARDGLIGAAHGGHLLLDEIGELPESHQAHLLRVLDAGGGYQRLGESAERVSDFRLIAATNRDPRQLKPDFRARFGDTVKIPSLNRRRSDIPLLMRELVARLAGATPHLFVNFLAGGDPTQARFEPLLVEALLRHDYSYNTRELSRLLRLASTTSRGSYLTLTAEVEALLAAPADEGDGDGAAAAGMAGNDSRSAQGITKEQALAALAESGNNITQAALQLGLTRHSLRRLMLRFGIERN